MNSIFIKLTGNKERKVFGRVWISARSDQSLWSYVPLNGEKKWYFQLFSLTFDQIFVKLAGKEDRHKSSDEFEFGPDRIIRFGVIRPWVRNLFPQIYLRWAIAALLGCLS